MRERERFAGQKEVPETEGQKGTGSQERGGLSRISEPGRGRGPSGSAAAGAASRTTLRATNPSRGRGLYMGRWTEVVKAFKQENAVKGGVYV